MKLVNLKRITVKLISNENCNKMIEPTYLKIPFPLTYNSIYFYIKVLHKDFYVELFKKFVEHFLNFTRKKSVTCMEILICVPSLLGYFLELE